MYKILPPKKERFPKLEKVDGPSPGTYDLDNSYRKVRNLSVSFQFGKTKKSNFTDIDIKR